MRLQNRTAIVLGGGQTPGETIGNGRATAILFAREGAAVMVVDHRLDSAEETVAMIEGEGGKAFAHRADVTREPEIADMVRACIAGTGRIDILHNNVGKSEGDAEAALLDEAAWDAIMDLNLKSFYLATKHVLPHMRTAGGGVILNVSSIAAICSMPALAYKASKAAINAMTQQLAVANASYGIRVNGIMPGLMDTPMAIERRARERQVDRSIIRGERDRQVPLGGRMGTAWDVAHAAVFLASDEARFITGVSLAVDGGQSARIG